VIFIASPFAHTDFLINEMAWLQVRGNLFFMVLFGGRNKRKLLICRCLLVSILLVQASVSSDKANKCIGIKCLFEKGSINKDSPLCIIL
jgi:hypothetical protein